jgi:membrane-associated phospholipid phosphatase
MLSTPPHSEPTSSPAPGWLSVGTVRNLLRAFVNDFAAVPRLARRRWLTTLGVGFVVSLAIVGAITEWGRSHLADGSRLAEEDALLLAFMADHRPISLSNALLLESFGNLAFVLPLTLLCFAIAARRRRPLLASAFVITCVLQWPIVLLGWWMWERPRPDLRAAWILAPSVPSFPSGHAALTFSAYGLLVWLWIRSTQSWGERILAAALFVLLLTVVGWSSVVLITQWPSDVLAGWLAGLTWLLSVIVAQVLAERPAGR